MKKLIISLAIFLTFSPILRAQICKNVITDEDIAKYFDEKGCTSRYKVYEVSAVAGERAVPWLRKLIESGRCVGVGSEVDAYIALARFGDQDAFRELEKQLYEKRYNEITIEQLAFVRNNQAISILMTYFSKYRADPSPNRDHRDSDAISDHLATLINKMWRVAFARSTPAIDAPEQPFIVIGNAKRDAWEAWWNKQKDIPFSSSDHSDISDPQLRCLARMIEWGMPKAAMLMTELPGKEKEAKSILNTFQRESGRSFGSMSGTITVALVRLGDEAIMAELKRDLGSKSQYTRNPVIETMRIANTKESIDILLNALEIKIDGVDEDSINRGKILNALPQMVENPPLGADVDPTPENIQK